MGDGLEYIEGMETRGTQPMVKGTIGGLAVEVRKDFYLGLWNIYYVDGGKWAGPFKTKREAVERLKLEEARGE